MTIPMIAFLLPAGASSATGSTGAHSCCAPTSHAPLVIAALAVLALTVLTFCGKPVIVVCYGVGTAFFCTRLRRRRHRA